VNAVPVITGLGLITPLGRNVSQTWASLLSGASIRNHARIDLDQPDDHPRVTQLALRAAHEAVAQARWRQRSTASDSTAIIVATSKGPVESWIAPPPPSTSDKPSTRVDSHPAKPAMVSPVYGLASIATTLANEFDLQDAPRLTLSAACASGLHALIRGAMVIRAGEASRVLIVAAEASVHPLFLGSFGRLGVLPPEGVPCRPFDQNRKGFLMSEAAAAVCLEAYDPESDQSVKPIVAIDRFALAGDAMHLTAGDPSGVVMRRLLHEVVQNQLPDLIHAHGTGTRLNDEMELAAIESIMACDRPAAHSTSDNPCYVKFDGGEQKGGSAGLIYSHKGAMGHSLGASGLVSVVLNCQAHMNGIVPPNVNTLQPIRTRWTSVSSAAVKQPIRRSIVCATGFGGPTSVVSLVSP
jgi:3-oxoacyl-[acyl-carrier-protein] synthase II